VCWRSGIHLLSCDVYAVSVANCIMGLCLPGFCSAVSLFCWWCAWMKNCLYGMSDGVCFTVFNSVMILSIRPYSWQLFSICRANADCGLFLM
jgi:hypothetical protein